jgi:hypothetical protein
MAERRVIQPTTHRLCNVETWGRDIITIVWRYVLDTWYCRNNIEHKKDADNISKLKERLIAKIEWLHEKYTNTGFVYSQDAEDG